MYKRRSPFSPPSVWQAPPTLIKFPRRRGVREMHPQVLLCSLAVLSAACHMDAYPMYPESDGVQDFVPTDFNLEDNAAGFISDNTASTGLRQPRNLNSVLSALEEGISQIQKAGHWKGGKETSPEDAPDNLVNDVKMILWKLVATDQLQSQGFTKSEQPRQKPNKRDCFWKYCVTN